MPLTAKPFLAQELLAPLAHYAVKRSNGDFVTDAVAEEVPVALVYNGISHAVMLASPQDLEDFALGFSLSEGIINSPSDIYNSEIVPESNGLSLQLDIATDCFNQLKNHRRTLAGRTGCGLCGTDSLAHAIKPAVQLKSANLRVNQSSLHVAYQKIATHQVLQAATGATHASAWVNVDGEILLVREDVGRHNALDKLIGAIAKAQLKVDAGFILTTSRASYEMVQKTVSADVQLLAAVSAPTGLAIRMADQSGLTLVGFLRERSYVIYSQTDRVI